MADISPEERKELHDELKDKFEYTFDMDDMPAVTHKWVDRGTYLSCEGGSHLNHRHLKR